MYQVYLLPRFIAPVAALIETPAGAVYVPPAVPVCVTVAVPVAQYGTTSIRNCCSW